MSSSKQKQKSWQTMKITGPRQSGNCYCHILKLNFECTAEIIGCVVKTDFYCISCFVSQARMPASAAARVASPGPPTTGNVSNLLMQASLGAISQSTWLYFILMIFAYILMMMWTELQIWISSVVVARFSCFYILFLIPVTRELGSFGFQNFSSLCITV